MKAHLLLICPATMINFGNTKISFLESMKKTSPLSEENLFIAYLQVMYW